MRYEGIDTAAPLKLETIHKLKENNISFVGRYLVPKTYWKALKPEEIKNLHDNSISIFLCWENDGNDMKVPSNGYVHGMLSRNLAKEYGVPKGTTIFFACDYNVQKEEYIKVEAYLNEAKKALGDEYEAGLYGHNRIIDYIAQKGLIKKFWQCVAWSNGVVSKFTDIYQYQWQGGPQAQALCSKIGVAVDLCTCQDLEAAGLWLPPKKTHWYDDDIAWVEEHKIMNDGRPEDNLTRAEAAAMLHRLYDLIKNK